MHRKHQGLHFGFDVLLRCQRLRRGKYRKGLQLPLQDHPSFDRPDVTTRLWRYMDLPKFVELITSGTLWLTNAEVLAADDPHEGLPNAVQFPHRMWRSIDDTPELLRRQIIDICGGGTDGTPEAAFKSWFMGEEQRCIMTHSGRRDFYINCWHAADHESVAMWKIYGSPGAGVAMVTNGARLETALAENDEVLHLGAVKYRDASIFNIGSPNAFDDIMVKRASYTYESEVRLIHWHTGEFHDALEKFAWNEQTMRFDDLIEDTRPIRAGCSFACDLNVLIERVIISPFAPPWYVPMMSRLRDRLGLHFSINRSKLLEAPVVIT